jgi:hypothetical protein
VEGHRLSRLVFGECWRGGSRVRVESCNCRALVSSVILSSAPLGSICANSKSTIHIDFQWLPNGNIGRPDVIVNDTEGMDVVDGLQNVSRGFGGSNSKVKQEGPKLDCRVGPLTFNLIENLWNSLKSNIRKRKDMPSSHNELIVALQAEWATLDIEVVNYGRWWSKQMGEHRNIDRFL